MDEVSIKLSLITRESLRNLCVVLGIKGESWDEKVEGLINLAVKARTVWPEDKTRPPAYKRSTLYIRQDTKDRLLEVHTKLSPFKHIEQWDEFLLKVCNLAEIAITEGYKEETPLDL